MKVLWLRRLRSTGHTDFHLFSSTNHTKVNSTKLNYFLLGFKSKRRNFLPSVVNQNLFCLPLLALYWAPPVSILALCTNTKQSGGWSPNDVNRPQECGNLWLCNSFVSQREEPPLGVLDLTLELPKPSHTSQHCGEMLLCGSPRITTEQFPLELVSGVGIVTAPEGNGQLGWDEWLGPLSSKAWPLTDLRGDSRHMFCCEEPFLSTWFLAGRKVYSMTHFSRSPSVNFGRVLLLLLQTIWLKLSKH